jgi:hypothetical protein
VEEATNRQDAKDAKKTEEKYYFFPCLLGVLGVLAVRF